MRVRKGLSERSGGRERGGFEIAEGNLERDEKDCEKRKERLVGK